MLALAPSNKDTPKYDRQKAQQQAEASQSSLLSSSKNTSDHRPRKSIKNALRRVSTLEEHVKKQSDHVPKTRELRRVNTVGGGSSTHGNNTKRQSSIALKRAASQRKLLNADKDKANSSRNLDDSKKPRKRRSSRNLMADASAKTTGNIISSSRNLMGDTSSKRNLMTDASAKTTGGGKKAHLTKKGKSKSDATKLKTKISATLEKGSKSEHIPSKKGVSLEKESKSEHAGQRRKSSKKTTLAKRGKQKSKDSHTTAKTSSTKGSSGSRPSLIRSNSLDSKLSHMEETEGEAKLQKKSSSLLESKKTLESKSDHGKKSSSRDNSSGNKGSSKRKSTKLKRPSLTRSNSLDSKLSNLEEPSDAKVQKKSLDSKSDHGKKSSSSKRKSSKLKRPSLTRSNSLDSKLSNLEESEANSKLQKSSDHGKKSSSNKRKSSKARSPRPSLTRSNSLDSMLSNTKEDTQPTDRRSLLHHESSGRWDTGSSSRLDLINSSDHRPARPARKGAPRRVKTLDNAACKDAMLGKSSQKKKPSLRRVKTLESNTLKSTMMGESSRRSKTLESHPEEPAKTLQKKKSLRGLDGLSNHSTGKRKSTKGRPKLARSNSLDSKLSNLEEEPKQQATKPRPGLASKQVSIRRLKALDVSTGTRGLSRRRPTRPSLVRSNSLDSKLSHLTEEGPANKPPQKERRGRRPTTTHKDKKDSKPTLPRSNSLDSKLSHLTEEGKAKQQATKAAKKDPHGKRSKFMQKLDMFDSSFRNMFDSVTDLFHTTTHERSRSKSRERGKSNEDNKANKSPGGPKLFKFLNKNNTLERISSHRDMEDHASNIDETTLVTAANQPTSKQEGPTDSAAAPDEKLTSHSENSGSTRKASNAASPLRPLLARSNSLDSMLDSMADEDEDIVESDEEEEEPNESSATTEEIHPKAEASEKAGNKKPNRRSMFAKRLSSRKSMGNRRPSRRHVQEDSLNAPSNHSVVSTRRGRARSRRSVLGDQLAATDKQGGNNNDPRSIAANGYFQRRSNSVDSRYDGNNDDDAVATRDIAAPRRGNRRSLAGTSTNYALKQFVERTAKEESAAEEQKQLKREKLTNLQKTFHNISKEQSKFTDTLLAKMSSLSRMPTTVNPLAALGGGPSLQECASVLNPSTSVPSNMNALERLKRSSITGSAMQDGSALSHFTKSDAQTEDKNKVEPFKRSTSISDMAHHMKDLSVNYRASKKQSTDQSGDVDHHRRRTSSIERLKGEIPLLAGVRMPTGVASRTA